MEWFYGGLGGIRQTENSIAYKEVLISPNIVGGISSASASFESPYGAIVSEWKKTDTELNLKIQIPANARAVVQIPAEGDYTLLESGDPLESVGGLEVLSVNEGILSGNEGTLTLRIGSGKYYFTITVQ